jgi:hypothetical protein
VLEDILAFEASSLASDSIKATDSTLNISPDIQVWNYCIRILIGSLHLKQIHI